MEIVNNGELLESQVIEDASSRARRLIEAAERECAAIRADGEAKLQDELGHAARARESRVETLRRELAASLPLDFHRTRLAFLQESMDRALRGYLGGLSDEDVGAIIGAILARAAPAFAGRRALLRCAGVDGAEARRIAGKNLPAATVEGAAAITAEEAETAVKGIIVECADGSRRCRATLGELTRNLTEEHREELITALFGKDANT